MLFGYIWLSYNLLFQNFVLSWRNEVKTRNGMCLDVSDSSFKAKITFYGCHKAGGNQLWHYDYVCFHFLNFLIILINLSKIFRKK